MVYIVSQNKFPGKVSRLEKYNMLIINLLSNPILFIGFILAILIAISIHETAHAWMANRLGDSTAKLAGRISLNPLVHLDPMGTIFLFLAGFGWGKPVPVNQGNFKNPKLDELKVALAGPLSNLLAAILFSLILRFLPLSTAAGQIIFIIIQINVALMIFNLLPIPPLDGSSILQIILPEDAYRTIQQFGIFLLFAFLIFIFLTPYFSNFITGSVNFIMKILLGTH